MAKKQHTIMQDVCAKLGAYGYTVAEADSLTLPMFVAEAERTACNQTNQSCVPEGLHWVVVNMAVGAFLQAKAATGQLDETMMATAVKSIHEGDTSITYAVRDDSAAGFSALISDLTHSAEDEFARYRRLQW